METKWKSFSALTKDELYALLNLRQQVFVVEQDCPFIDADFKDQDCDHLLAYQNNELAGYLRVAKPGKRYEGPEIARVLTAEKIRRQGAGKILTKEAIEFLRFQISKSRDRPISSVQAYTIFMKVLDLFPRERFI